MALIGKFDLKYYNKNYYKSETLNTLPTIIEKNKVRVLSAKIAHENGGKPHPSLDSYEESKAHWYMASELYDIARNTYATQLTTGIHNIEECIIKFPEAKTVLEKALADFKGLLDSVK